MTDPKKPKPKTDYDSATGKIPPAHFDDDLPFTPGADKSPGSLYDHIDKQNKK
ncbi:MAG TPA: hypothetical protein VM867_04785 [Xanthobacteraceae bacterium]|nr:hypothetical protein [Xanthobacteraceae bacterium]